MSEQRYEYRVRWERGRRELDTSPGPVRYSAIRQSEVAARAKVARLIEIDEQQRDGEDPLDDFDRPIFDFPRLLAPPTIERRTVGDWESA